MSRQIVLDGVTKIYGKRPALLGASAVWDEGGIVALVGANGGGKSTLLKLLSGVIHPDVGSIQGLDQFSMASMPDRLAFSRGWTAEDWLAMVASWKKAPRARIREVLVEAGLEDARRKSVAAFSQGMVRRLLYAQTRLTEADLVLLDEPEGGLDPEWTVRLELELDRLRGEGKTVILSTHWLDLAVEKADRLCVFATGKIVAQEDTVAWRGLDSATRRHRLVRQIQGPL
jgi:ABC-type multidrug transport system ATPase subunit